MKIASGSSLEVALHWSPVDVQSVGRLAYIDGVAYLEYASSFLTSGLELSPVHHKLGPGLIKPHDQASFEGLHGIFHDSLPDGWGRLLIDRRARQLSIEPSTLTPLDRLACVGFRSIGALTYAPATNIWIDGKPVLDLDKLAIDSQQVLKGNISDILDELGRVGGSPGGARPKALIAINDKEQVIHGDEEVPNGYTHYLVKFPGSDDPTDIAQIEQAYADMAIAAGINFPKSTLLSGENGKPYFAVQRFDRDGSKRNHMHSASGLLYSDIRIPSLDYQDLILLTRSLTRDHRQSRSMFTLAVFNVLAHNRDDHARQFSYTMERDGTWKLSPAYDLTFSYGPGGEHSTSVLGHGKSITREHLIALGKKADLKNSDIATIIERVETAIADWPQYAAQWGVSQASKQEVSKAIKLVRL